MPRKKRHRVLRWLAVLAWAAVIFAGSSVPGSQIPGGYSEIGHLGEYAVFGALVYIALRADLDRTRALALAVVVCSLYGVTDEFHQHFVVMRTPDAADWALDTVGAFVGAFGALAIGSAFARRRAGSPEAGTPQ